MDDIKTMIAKRIEALKNQQHAMIAECFEKGKGATAGMSIAYTMTVAIINEMEVWHQIIDQKKV